jgi:hypothetical protein
MNEWNKLSRKWVVGCGLWVEEERIHGSPSYYVGNERNVYIFTVKVGD